MLPKSIAKQTKELEIKKIELENSQKKLDIQKKILEVKVSFKMHKELGIDVKSDIGKEILIGFCRIFLQKVDNILGGIRLYTQTNKKKMTLENGKILILKEAIEPETREFLWEEDVSFKEMTDANAYAGIPIINKEKDVVGIIMASQFIEEEQDALIGKYTPFFYSLRNAIQAINNEDNLDSTFEKILKVGDEIVQLYL